MKKREYFKKIIHDNGMMHEIETPKPTIDYTKEAPMWVVSIKEACIYLI